MDVAKTDGIRDWPKPTSVKEIQSFLGFSNFYRNFIPHYSDITQPLIDPTKKTVVFSWGDLCDKAFKTLKACFLCQLVLRNPDASLVTTGAVLLQTDENGVYHPCGYLSQTLNPTERNYQIFNCKLLAVI
jgi:hypothetical protein